MLALIPALLALLSVPLLALIGAFAMVWHDDAEDEKQHRG